MREILSRKPPCREIIIAELRNLAGGFQVSSGSPVDQLVSPSGAIKTNLLEETFPEQAVEQFFSWLETYRAPWATKTEQIQNKGPEGTFGRSRLTRKRGIGRYSS